jgi:hypothetical protein
VEVDPIEVRKALRGLEYPADVDEVVRQAETNDAPEEVIEALQELAGTFDGPDEVEASLG